MNQPVFGDELRGLRRQRGLSLKKFARLVHFDPGYLSKIENGLKPPTATVASRCDAALDAGGRLAQLISPNGAPGRQHRRHSGNPTAPYPLALWEPDVVVDHAVELTGFDLALSRRGALARGTTVLAGAALLDPLWNWLLPSVSESGRNVRGLSEDEVVAMEMGVHHLRSWSRQRSGGMARKAAVAQLRELSDRLRSVRSGILRDRAFLAGAQLARLVASLAWDAGSHIEAQRYYVLSIKMAYVARDSGYAALALADLARQSLDLERPQDALELTQLAQYGARNSRAAKLRTFLLAREAWALAHLNRTREFRRAVGQAADLFAENDDVSCPAWLENFDEAELLGVIGARYRDLAAMDPRHASLAEQYIQRALSVRAPNRIRNRTFDLIGLARTYLVMTEPEQGCLVARQALEINGETLYGRPKRKLQEFCRELLPYKNTRAGREFSEYLRNLSN